MFRLVKQITFEASHVLPNHDGKCSRLHGHSWRADLVLVGKKLIESGPKKGMLEDFGDISKSVEFLLENFLDHRHLNETTGLSDPTSECLAKWIFDRLRPHIPYLTSVRVHETCTCSAEYLAVGKETYERVYGGKELV